MSRVLLMTILVLGLAGAGVTGAYMVGDDLGWTGGHHHMAGDRGADCPVEGGAHPEDCPHEYLEECEESGEECGEHSDDCGHAYSGRGCW